MPIYLTTPFNPGDLDTGKTYPRAQIAAITIGLEPGLRRSPFITTRYNFGDIVSGVWTRGNASPDMEVRISDTDYETMVASGIATESEDYNVYNAVKRIIYTYLIDNGYLVGTIE